jgi:hypothetical protein
MIPVGRQTFLYDIYAHFELSKFAHNRVTLKYKHATYGLYNHVTETHKESFSL